MRSYLSTPPSAAKGPPSQPVLARRDHARGLRQPPVCRHAPKISHPISHNLSQSLVYLSSISTFPLHFRASDKETTPTGCLRQEPDCDSAQCPCTKTAICAGAGAVNHPHHINHMNHSSNKCQPSLIHALTPVNPSIRRKRPPARPVLSPARARAPPPVCRHAPKISHTISHNLS